MKDFIAFCKWLFAPVPPAKADPDCRHCRGAGYDASAYPCTCIGDKK